jgi:hypothetical protein
MKKYLLKFRQVDGKTFDYSLFADSLGDADRRGQHLEQTFDAILIDVAPV